MNSKEKCAGEYCKLAVVRIIAIDAHGTGGLIMRDRRSVVWYRAYPFIEGKRVKWYFWNGKMWIECDSDGNRRANDE